VMPTIRNHARDRAIGERMRAGEHVAAIGADLGLSASGVYAVNRREKARRPPRGAGVARSERPSGIARTERPSDDAGARRPA
jgi:hypothetical protein